ncbi:MAG TPA: hypothetical protein VK472_01885 [Allosphingosinicella sp.]|jgi:hypothetical protein|nr:hypothetical protein [Allosphingosinicella sp.]
MTDGERSGVPGWYWAVALLALLWEGFGCWSYISWVTMDAATLAAMPAGERDMWLAMPPWLTGVFAIAVWVGLAGAVALLMRRRLARLAFGVSLAAAVVQFGWIFLTTPIMTTIGPSAALMPAAIIIVGGIWFLFAGAAVKRGWLR